uniref:Ig-like domain-containing protein n=1 Tax=Sinocyclocheilus anshuiensis TaxID=1608454 RepID=A0A671KQ00_9TELE
MKKTFFDSTESSFRKFNVCLLIALLLFSALDSPDVHIVARKAPDDHSKLVLICLATGFYPRDIEMNIRLNRINIESQTSSGIRPNADGSFQLRSSVKVDRKHKGSYDCFVIHSSRTEPWDI